jgi:hypothetical protein
VRDPAGSNTLGAPGRFQLLCDLEAVAAASTSTAAKEPWGEMGVEATNGWGFSWIFHTMEVFASTKKWGFHHQRW